MSPSPSLQIWMSSVRAAGSPASTMQPPCARPGRSSADATSSQTPLWRPWVFTSTDQGTPERLAPAESTHTPPGCSPLGRKSCFQHPVRLFWPRAKSYDHLFSDGEALLKNFPVQATISFYEESDSEDEDEECCEERHTWGD